MYDRECPFIYGDLRRRQIPLDVYLFIYFICTPALMLMIDRHELPGSNGFRAIQVLALYVDCKRLSGS
jgi:hypothetical protein